MAKAKPRKSRALKPEEKEVPIQKQIRLLLGSRRDILALRINVGVFKKGPYHIRSAPTGTHDLLCCQLRRVQVREVINPNGFNPVEQDVWHYYGQFISIETKSVTGPARKEQKDFAHACMARGAISVFARSIADVENVIGPKPDWLDEIPEHLQFKVA